MTTWINKWNSWISTEPVARGVWLRRDGGFYVKSSATSPKTGKEKEVRKNLPNCKTASEARATLDVLLGAVRAGDDLAQKTKPRFRDYVLSFVEDRSSIITVRGGWKSASTKSSWGSILETVLLPRFGSIYIDKISTADLRAWQASLAKDIQAKRITPGTANTWIKKFRAIANAFVKEYKLQDNPAEAIELFDVRVRPTYTKEQPNSLTPSEVQRFLEAARVHRPQCFAMFALGFATGLRPSSLRPLRYRGEAPDLDLEEGTLQIRRSHSLCQIAMPCTKTGTQYEIVLPRELVDILRWHVVNLSVWCTGARFEKADRDLLFPGWVGFLGPATIRDFFLEVSKLAGIKKHVTPRAMRRTFQDLARASKVDNFVTRSISGHATEQMQEHYSTIYGEEQRAGMAKIISLAGVREAHAKTIDQLHDQVHADQPLPGTFKSSRL